MKKYSLVLSAVIIAGLFTACGNKTEGETDNSETVSQTESSSETGSESETSSESESESESGSESGSESESTAESESGSESEAESNSDSEAASSENPLKELADTALSVGEWPDMVEVTDADIISEYFLLDVNNPNYKNLIIMQCPMSANMSELIIIEADDTQTASDDLDARLKKAKEIDAFYPDDVEKADNAIVGTAGDYAYYIFSYEPEKSEEALLMQIEG